MRLELVTEEFLPNDRHSIRAADLTAETLSDLEGLASKVLAPAMVGVRELQAAVERRDRDAAIPALRRLLAVGLIAKDYADFIESEPS